MNVSAEKRKLVVEEIKNTLRKKNYVTSAQMFADVALELRKKGICFHGKSIGGTDVIKKIWEEHCRKDYYWRAVNARAKEKFTNYIGKDTKQLRKKVEEIFAPLKSVTTKDFLAAMVKTGLSEDTVREIKKKIFETVTVKKPKSSFVSGAAALEEKIQNLEKQLTENVSRVTALAGQLEEIEKAIRNFEQETDNMKSLVKTAWRSLADVAVRQKEGDCVEDALALFCQRQAEVWKRLHEDLTTVGRTKLPKLAVHKDDTSPFYNAGSI